MYLANMKSNFILVNGKIIIRFDFNAPGKFIVIVNTT